MTRNEKIELLFRLEDRGVVRQEMPEPEHNTGGTKYWPFKVLQPKLLPDSLRPEYDSIGELRW